MFWLIKMSFAVFVWHRLNKLQAVFFMHVWFNWVTRSQTNIWHLHLQQKTGPWFSQVLTDRTNHRDMAAAQTSCDCRRAIRASGEDAIPSWLASIIPPPCRSKAHSSRHGHVLRGERCQLLSSVIITHSQTSWNKDATKDPVEVGPTVPRAYTHEKSHETSRSSMHDITPRLGVSHAPLTCTEEIMSQKEGQRHENYRF